jgi:hypothetical protein
MSLSQGVMPHAALGQAAHNYGTFTSVTPMPPPTSEKMDRFEISGEGAEEDTFEVHFVNEPDEPVDHPRSPQASESSGLGLLSDLASGLARLPISSEPPQSLSESDGQALVSDFAATQRLLLLSEDESQAEKPPRSFEAPTPIGGKSNPFLDYIEPKAHDAGGVSGTRSETPVELSQSPLLTRQSSDHSVPLHAPVPRRGALPTEILSNLNEPLSSPPQVTRQIGLPRTVSMNDLGDFEDDIPVRPSSPRLVGRDVPLTGRTFQPLPEPQRPGLTRSQSLDDLLGMLSSEDSRHGSEEEVDSPLMTRHGSVGSFKMEELAPETESPGVQAHLLDILAIPYPVRLLGGTGAGKAQPAKEAAEPLSKANVVGLGDLHGVYRKLVETLGMANMMQMPTEVAQRFVELANHPDNYSDHPRKLAALSKELHKLVPAMKWTGGDRTLVLIGDVIGDRGPFDQITQSIIEHLTRDNPGRIVRIAGNHEHNVLRHMIYKLNGIDDSCTPSLARSYAIAGSSLPQELELKEQYGRYIGKTQLLHYDPKSKTLYTHAPIHKDNAQQLIAWLQSKSEAYGLGKVLNYEEMKTEQDMSRFVKQANRAYQQYVAKAIKSGALDLKTEEMLITANDGHGFLWRRSKLDREADLPFKECGVKRIVHGHDNLSQESPFGVEKNPSSGYQVVNLDQDARKYDAVKTFGDDVYQQFMRENGHLLKPDSRLYIE